MPAREITAIAYTVRGLTGNHTEPQLLWPEGLEKARIVKQIKQELSESRKTPPIG